MIVVIFLEREEKREAERKVLAHIEGNPTANWMGTQKELVRSPVIFSFWCCITAQATKHKTAILLGISWVNEESLVADILYSLGFTDLQFRCGAIVYLWEICSAHFGWYLYSVGRLISRCVLGQCCYHNTELR